MLKGCVNVGKIIQILKLPRKTSDKVQTTLEQTQKFSHDLRVMYQERTTTKISVQKRS